MKKFALMLALIASATVLTPSLSEARDHRHGSSRRVAYHCRACGDSVYQERYYAGRDRYGRPISSWRTIGHRCRYDRGHHRGHGHGHHRGTHISGPGFHFDFGRR